MSNPDRLADPGTHIYTHSGKEKTHCVNKNNQTAESKSAPILLPTDSAIQCDQAEHTGISLLTATAAGNEPTKSQFFYQLSKSELN